MPRRAVWSSSCSRPGGAGTLGQAAPVQAWSLRTTGPRGALVRVARGAHLVEQPALLQPARRRLLLQLPQGESQRSSNMNRPHKNEACSSSSHKKPPRPSGGGGGGYASVCPFLLSRPAAVSRGRGAEARRRISVGPLAALALAAAESRARYARACRGDDKTSQGARVRARGGGLDARERGARTRQRHWHAYTQSACA